MFCGSFTSSQLSDEYFFSGLQGLEKRASCGPFSRSWWEVCFTKTREFSGIQETRFPHRQAVGEAGWNSAGGRSPRKRDRAQSHPMDCLSMFGKVRNSYLIEFSVRTQVVCICRAHPVQLWATFTPFQHIQAVSVKAAELSERWTQGKGLSGGRVRNRRSLGNVHN